MKPDLNIGDFVEYSGEDSCYRGNIVSIFQKKGGKYRVVVENDEGLLLIKGTKCKLIDTVQGLWLELKNLIEEWYKGKDVFLDIPSHLNFITLVEDATKGLDVEIERDGFIIRLKKIPKKSEEVTLEEFYKNPYIVFPYNSYGYNNALNLGEMVYRGKYRILTIENDGGYTVVPDRLIFYKFEDGDNAVIISKHALVEVVNRNGNHFTVGDVRIGDTIILSNNVHFTVQESSLL